MANIRFLAKGKVGEIWLYDQVGEGWFGGMSAKSFVKEMTGLGKVDTINLHINSPGGDVFDGVAIYNSLKSHPARIEVDIDGIAASIASVIAMAGDEIRIASNAMMMIHDPYTLAVGNADDMRKSAELLDQIGGIIATTYADRTKQSQAVVSALMGDETWMDATTSVQYGFADVTTEPQRIAACVGDMSRFKNLPSQLKSRAAEGAGDSASRVRISAMQKKTRNS